MQPSFCTPSLSGRSRGAVQLLGDALRRKGGRRVLSVLSAVLFLAGIGLFAYPLFTDLYQRQVQGGLRSSFGGQGTVDAYTARKFREGQGLTRLRISSVGIDVLVVEGTTPGALQAGAGHYVGTPLPGEAGNVAIAGHRTTFGHPFNRLDEVTPGTSIELRTPRMIYTYRSVQSFDGQADPHPVSPTDVSVIAAPKDAAVHELTLTTCTPKGSAAQRLILRAVLVSSRALPGVTPSPSQASRPSNPASTRPAPLASLPGPQ